ncbi:hypothetical protein HCN44_003471 [Aphidius gifuensis]|uniref:Uncharacterized protein n=1 Tax=Aphidius gifuensis TaxID=684658 RepID=A0A834XK11_APHGI|nr:hypothetical protein HCN44_003471 [Aphidius gifuensis]
MSSSRTEDKDNGAEHQHLHGGYSALHTTTNRPASLSSRDSRLYGTILEVPLVPLAASQQQQQQQPKNNFINVSSLQDFSLSVNDLPIIPDTIRQLKS